MSRRVFVWLTDEEGQLYDQMAEKLGIDYTQLATYLVCAHLTPDEVPLKKKGRSRWLSAHEAKTRREYQNKGTGTASRIETTMRTQGQGQPWTSKELASALGWKKGGSINSILREDSRFKEVPRPADWTREPGTRGASPKFWVLADDSR